MIRSPKGDNESKGITGWQCSHCGSRWNKIPKEPGSSQYIWKKVA